MWFVLFFNHFARFKKLSCYNILYIYRREIILYQRKLLLNWKLYLKADLRPVLKRKVNSTVKFKAVVQHFGKYTESKKPSCLYSKYEANTTDSQLSLAWKQGETCVKLTNSCKNRLSVLHIGFIRTK